MAETKISDIIVPEVFNPYVSEKTKSLSALINSGIMISNPHLDALAAAGGSTINMPFFRDLTGSDEVLSDARSLTPGAIGTASQIAILLLRGKAWGANELAGSLAGADPVQEIGDKIAHWWALRIQAIAIATLTGIFADNAANDSGDLIYDISQETLVGLADANLISGEAVVMAEDKKGDSMEEIVAMAIHSKVYTKLKLLNLIDYIVDSEAKTRIPVYQNKIVIVDDNCPKRAGTTSGFVYTSYLFTKGALGFGDGGAPTPSETDRNALAGVDYLISRKHLLVHPNGFAWQSQALDTAADPAPANTDLVKATQWDRVAIDAKQIGVLQLITNG